MKIKHLLGRSWDVKMEHIYQESNQADALMVFMGNALSLGLHVYCVPLEDIQKILSEDANSVALPSLIC